MFKIDGNLPLFKDSLKNPQMQSANMWALFFKFLYVNIGALYSFARIKFLKLFKNLTNTDKRKLKVRPDV